MSDVFLSYSSQDRERAKRLAERLEAHGFSVWWDRVIPPGSTFDQVIEEALESAGCVVVMWSEASVASSWVKTEAAEGARREALIPVQVEPVRIPLEFRRLQTADLTEGSMDANNPELLKAVHAIRTLLKREQTGAKPTESRPEEPTSERRSWHLGSRDDGGGFTLRQLAMAYFIGGVALAVLDKVTTPQPILGFLYLLLIPIFAIVRLRDVPFRSAAVFAVTVLVGALITDRPEGRDLGEVAPLLWLVYLGFAATSRWMPGLAQVLGRKVRGPSVSR